MNDKKVNNKENEIKTPLSVMMDMSKNEIANFVFGLMHSNNIPPFLMCYVIKSVLCDVQQMALEKLSDSVVRFQESEKNGGKANGN